jgi:N-acetylmuramoyl-L-alanine amidase
MATVPDLSTATEDSFMKVTEGLRLALLGALGAGTSGVWTPATAVQFDQQEVDPNRLLAIAAPVGTSAHQLLILEQLNNSRPCWRETGSQPTRIEPLLLNFDFTGICNRSTDSNGYSLRVGGQDLGMQYSLRVVQQGNDLVLMAVANSDRTAPLEIGRANGTTDGFAKIQLNPGWRMTKRVYQGRVLPHIYLTNDQALPTLIAAATNQPATISPSPMPSTVGRPNLPAPTASRPQQPPISRPVPVASAPEDLPTVRVPAQVGTRLPTPSSLATGTGLAYRVIVQADTADQQAKVRAIAPDAFRTSVNGRSVLQAGRFRSSATAYALRQQLGEANLLAWVATEMGQSFPTVPSPRPTPAPNAPEPLSTPPISQPGPVRSPVPRSRTVVVLDPGHGGPDVGAVGIGGLQEKDIVLPIAQQVAALLEQQGIQVVMTRRTDLDMDLAPRVAIAEQANADLFVSIHANSAGPNGYSANGVETYYYGSQAGRELAQSVQSNLVQTTGMNDRGVKTAHFYVISRTSMPAALVEVGFVTGSSDANRLSNAASRNQIAAGITRGILQYIRG